ncbi:MAG: hypothetical protein PWQ55_175 [Chloroflexota bacterium]|nr:hypothetical protein [Chloroflexota bacterium]
MLIILQGIAAAICLLLIPKEAGNADFLGYSYKRLAVLAAVLIALALACLLYWRLRKSTVWQTALTDERRRAALSRTFILGGFLLALASWCIAFFFHFLGLRQPVELFIRLLPLLIYGFAIGLESILFIASKWLDGEKHKSNRQFSFLFGKAFWIVLAILIGIWLLIEITDLGIDPEFVSINSLNVPLLEGQVWFMAGMIILILALAGAWARLPHQADKKGWAHPDLLICVALWALAAALWMSLPLPRNNYFAPRTLPPNFNIYPFSDAEQYDLNAIWIWKGATQGIVISKPLYVTFLAILHALAGLDYAKLILLQTLVLALLPVVMYWIGKEMHSRLGGLVLALFVILREMNSIQAVNFANVSNSKLLLSDTPSTLLIAVLLLLVIRWFKTPPGKDGKYPFLVGGLVAFLNLIRIQTMLLEPVLLVLLVIRYWKQYKKFFQALGLALLALALVLAPVLVRNHAITGVYWLDDPTTSSALYSFFLDENTEDLVDIPTVENDEDILNRNITVISQVLTQNFGNLAWSITDNFMHNVISTILIFPVRLGNQVDFFSFLHIDEPFWSEVYSRSNLLNALTLLLNLIIISIGIASAARKHLPSVLLVWGFYIIYSLSSSLVRISGWRFIQPVDWLAIAFYAFGLIEILRYGMSMLFGEFDSASSGYLTRYDPQPKSGVLNWCTLVAFGLVFLFTGSAIPLREVLFPVGYPDYTRTEVCDAFQSALVGSPWEERQAELQDFCMQENVLAYEGVGVSPRFFKAGSGFYKRNYDPFFGNQDYGRLVFRTVGVPNTKVYIKTDHEDIRFPDGTLVYVMGEDQRKFEARAVLIMAEEPQLIVSWPEEAEAE